MPFATSPQPRESVWGAIETAEQVLPGIWRVETSTHGGLVLSDERHAAMPDALRHDTPHYEADVHWALPVLAFETEFANAGSVGTSTMLQLAHDIARNWRLDAYAAFTGTAVEPRDSHVMRRRAAYEALIGSVVVTSASGSWADWVPDGKVGVVGRKVASVDYLGWPTYLRLCLAHLELHPTTEIEEPNVVASSEGGLWKKQSTPRICSSTLRSRAGDFAGCSSVR